MVTRASLDEGAKTAAENVAKMQDVTDVTLASSGPLQTEADSALQVLKEAVRGSCFIKITSFDEPEDLHDLEIGFARHQDVTLVLVSPPVKHF